MYDFLIIGAGVTGCSIARELSRFEADICILEKSADVSSGASKANSGIIHGGYAAGYSTLKGRLNVLGNRMFQQLDNELNFGYRKTGGMVLGFSDGELIELEKLRTNGMRNGIENLRIIRRKEILELEPNINSEVRYALLADDVGVVSPYEYNIALAENAVENGVKLFLDSEVVSIQKVKQRFYIETPSKTFEAKTVINSAGIYSDRISAMAGFGYFSIIPRKGEYILLRKGTGSIVNRVIFQVPTEKGKGILVTSTFHGNLMLGPNSEEVQDREDTETSEDTLEYIINTARKSVPGFDISMKLKTFSGLRPTPDTKDFIIKEETPGFINAAGIESPGLTSSPAVAGLVLDIILKRNRLDRKKYFNPYRKPIITKKNLSPEEIRGLIHIKSSPDKIICRCEQVSEGEIIDAITRNVGAKTVYGVKMRTRAGMGTCQGNFCRPRVQEILDRYISGQEKT